MKKNSANDKGICDFCGQPIEIEEEHLFIRMIDGHGSRIVHKVCFEERLGEEEE